MTGPRLAHPWAFTLPCSLPYWLAASVVVLGWLAMIDMVRTDMFGMYLGSAGPGMIAVTRLMLFADGFPSELWQSLCRAGVSNGISWSTWAEACRMASIMTLAMMLPGASPAWEQLRSGNSPGAGFAFMGGYASLWGLLSIGMASIDIGLQGLVGDHLVSTMGVSGAIAAGLVIMSGLFQFSSVKRHAQLGLKRDMLSAKSEMKTSAPFRAGLRYAACCGRSNGLLMSTMIVLGMMNLVAMALLTVVMVIEKRAKTNRLSGAIGIALLIAGCRWAWSALSV